MNESYTPPAVAGIADPATRYQLDHDRLLTHVSRPDGMDVTLDYGASTGQLLSLTQPRGVTRFGYDARSGQLTSTISPDTVSEAFAYDGPVLTSETWSGAVAGSVSRTLGTAYRDSTETVSAGGVSSTVTYGYDGDGLLTSVDSTGAPWHYAITRDANGLPSGTVLAEGAGAVTSQAGYNGYGELESLTYWIGAAPLFQQVIEHNQVGQVTAIEESWYGGPTTRRAYGYDLAGRLDSVAVAGVALRRYDYDSLRAGNGNRTAERDGDGNLIAAGTYDAQDRMTSYGNATYAYTAGGDLASRIMGGDTTGYAYDGLGSLVDVRLPGGDSLRYVMDGQGRRVGMKRNGIWQRRWLYGGAIPPLAELDASGALLNRYVYATLGHAPDLVLHGDTAYRVVTDQLGSVRAVVRASDGAIVQRTDYDAWGVVTADSGGAFQSLGYAGGLMDRATGLERFGARDYESGVGRWTVRDPSGAVDGAQSLYAYAAGSPCTLIDEAGLWPIGLFVDVWKAKGKAWRETDRKKLNGNYANAYRHVRATQIIAKKYGRVCAISAGVGYESVSFVEWLIEKTRGSRETWDQFVDDTKVDILNDVEGSTGEEPDELLREGRLYGPGLEHIPPRQGF